MLFQCNEWQIGASVFPNKILRQFLRKGLFYKVIILLYEAFTILWAIFSIFPCILVVCFIYLLSLYLRRLFKEKKTKNIRVYNITSLHLLSHKVEQGVCYHLVVILISRKSIPNIHLNSPHRIFRGNLCNL